MKSSFARAVFSLIGLLGIQSPALWAEPPRDSVTNVSRPFTDAVHELADRPFPSSLTPFLDELLPRNEVLEDNGIPYASGILKDVSDPSGWISPGQLSDNGDGTWTRELWLNVYYPPEKVRQFLPDPDKLPVMLVVHGGGLYNGNREKETIKDLAKRFAQRGYVALTLDYMLRQQDPQVGNEYYVSPAMKASADRAFYERRARSEEAVRRNLAACVHWIAVNAESYHIDLDRFAVAGSSAGSMIMLDLFWDQSYVGKPHVQPFITDASGAVRYTRPKALISLWGWLRRTGEDLLGPRPDLADYLIDHPNPTFSLKEHRSFYARPALHSYDQDILDADDVPVFFHHSTGDKVIPYIESAYLKHRLDELGVESQFSPLRSAPMGEPGFVGHAKFNPFYEQLHFEQALRFLYHQLQLGEN